MSASQPNLGTQIVDASRFITDVNKQIQALLVAADSVLAPIGFVAPNGSEVEFDFRRNIGVPEAWSQKAIGRFYARPTDDGARTQCALALEVHLQPSSSPHALLVIALAEFDQPVATREAGTEYRSGEWMELLLKGHYPERQSIELGRNEHPKQMKSASTIRIAAWPLVSIDGEQALRSHVLEWVTRHLSDGRKRED